MWISLNKRRKLDIAYHKTSCTSKKSVCNIIIILRNIHIHNEFVLIRIALKQGCIWNIFIWKTAAFVTQLYLVFSVFYISAERDWKYFAFRISNTKTDTQFYYLNYKIQNTFNLSLWRNTEMQNTRKIFLHCAMLKCKI